MMAQCLKQLADHLDKCINADNSGNTTECVEPQYRFNSHLVWFKDGGPAGIDGHLFHMFKHLLDHESGDEIHDLMKLCEIIGIPNKDRFKLFYGEFDKKCQTPQCFSKMILSYLDKYERHDKVN